MKKMAEQQNKKANKISKCISNHTLDDGIKLLGGTHLQETNNKNRNVLFIMASIIVSIFIISPLLLRIPCIRMMLSWFLQPLGDGKYESSYIETFGAIWGTFLAVAGTLWTQRKIDEVVEKKELKESALIIYYDFKIAFSDIITFMESVSFQQSKSMDKIDKDERYMKLKMKYRIYIDDDWSHNVAKLFPILSDGEIQMIYKLYGDLSTIKKVFNSANYEVSKDEDMSAFFIMHNSICKINAATYKVTLQDNIKNIMGRLKEIGNISDVFP